ncbi:hypothetical protein [Paracoccus angustae]|uniref:hypothetical protein n=1 Tax=Paracoccus angustae TaxID=1671480 RepID=UPI00366ABC47
MRIDHHAADRVLDLVCTVGRSGLRVLWMIGPALVRGMIMRVIVVMSRVETSVADA